MSAADLEANDSEHNISENQDFEDHNPLLLRELTGATKSSVVITNSNNKDKII